MARPLYTRTLWVAQAAGNGRGTGLWVNGFLTSPAKGSSYVIKQLDVVATPVRTKITWNLSLVIGSEPWRGAYWIHQDGWFNQDLLTTPQPWRTGTGLLPVPFVPPYAAAWHQTFGILVPPTSHLNYTITNATDDSVTDFVVTGWRLTWPTPTTIDKPGVTPS
jgi:hypothetical protein